MSRERKEEILLLVLCRTKQGGIRRMDAIDKECSNCKWFVDCENKQRVSVCPDWLEE